ncbi:hypothetical protein EW145_g3498 [Phellinidium pouzarii]|uniref:Uncharacterized protein n=1 Tax=Phellinidium pouzarii TaxID=167371 RepID=A0A4S4L6W2_9AGAM|nr:hypothetical protein EW145_g3498 [Phellinidium pouzarii]
MVLSRALSFPLFQLLLVLCLPSLSVSTSPIEESRSYWDPIRRSLTLSSRSNVPSTGYFDPRDNGGSFLTKVPDTFPAGLGEPINVILTANSDSAVLVDQESNGGLRNYYFAIGFAGECLGQHAGSDQEANLGDGNGYLNETAVIRWDYGDPTLGTCTETVKGGNHFRYWVQNGKSGNSNAVFMALSYEEPLSEQHDIIDNGYNLARDQLVGNATGGIIVPTSNLTNSSTYSGQTSYGGYTYQTSVQYVSGLLPNTSTGINHLITVGAGQNAVDGLVAVMTVKITQSPQRATASSS